MSFRIGDIVTLSFMKNLPTDPQHIATVVNMDVRHGEKVIELMFTDGYNDTYWEDQMELLSRQDDPEKVQQSQGR